MGNFALPFDAEAASESFRPVNELLDNFDDQAQREALIEEKITDADLQAEARFGIAEERERTFLELRSLPVSPYYEQVGRADIALDKEITAATEKLTEAESRTSSQQLSCDEDLQWCVKISPLSRQAAEELAQRKKDEIERRETGEARERLEQLKVVRGQIDSLFATGGRAWPVSPLMQIAPEESNGTDGQEFVDEIPVEPVIRPHEASPHNYDRHIYSPEVSKKAAEYLAVHSGQVIDVEGLASVLYPTEVLSSLDRHDWRSLVTTALGPKVNGQHIKDLLAELGLDLQYGWRRNLRETAGGEKRVKSICRIYRAIPTDAIDQFPKIITRGGDEPSIDSFEITSYSEQEPDGAEIENPLEEVENRVLEAIGALEDHGLLRETHITVQSVRQVVSSKFLPDKVVRQLISIGLVEKGVTRKDCILLSATQLVAAHLLNSRERKLVTNKQNLPRTLEVISGFLDAYFVKPGQLVSKPQ